MMLLCNKQTFDETQFINHLTSAKATSSNRPPTEKTIHDNLDIDKVAIRTVRAVTFTAHIINNNNITFHGNQPHGQLFLSAYAVCPLGVIKIMPK
jgi:hypothetical protein